MPPPTRTVPRRTTLRRHLAPSLLLVCACTCLIALSTQTLVAQESGPLRYQAEAGQARMQKTPEGETIYRYLDGAHFWDDQVDITGRRAAYFLQAGRMEVVEKVQVVTDSLKLWCDSLVAFRGSNEGFAYGSVRVETAEGAIGTGERGIYDKARNWLALVGHARVIDEDYVVEGDSIPIDRQSSVMQSFGHVSIVDEANASVVQGEHAVFQRSTGLAVVDSLPHLRSRRGQGPPTSVRSEWMSFDRESEVSTAIGDVIFRQGLTEAHADTARFLGDDELLLSGTPSVQQMGRVISGQQIRIFYDDGRLEHVEVVGKASLVDSTPDTLAHEYASIPLANTLSGDSLRIEFGEGEILRTYVAGNAHSIYLPEDQQNVVSVNDVSGHSVDINFHEGRVSHVEVRGQVQGSYRFLDLAEIPRLIAVADSVRAAEAAADSARAAEASADSARTAAATVDSVQAAIAPPDSAGADSTAGLVDFASLAQEVSYEGQETDFWVQEGRMRVADEAKVVNGTLELYADQVDFDTERREVVANGSPRLVDRNSEIVGEKMGYLFEPQTGAVLDGATRFDDGFYYGHVIRRIDRETLLVSDATYTTCDLEDPHYAFKASKMKLKIGRRVVARQIKFYVSDIPLIVLPFYYKSLDSGRHSGILFPNINLGVSSRDGRYVRGLGYYWAASDYTDFQFLLDYNERQDMRFTVKNVYKFRYGPSGNVDAWYFSHFGQNQQGNEWKVNARHSQPELWDVWRANLSLELSSSKLTRSGRSGNSQNDLIESRLYSTASLSRSFDSGASLNFSASRTQFPNAQDNDPIGTNNRISVSSVPLALSFKSRPLRADRPRPDDGWWAGILHDIQFSQSYNSQFDRRINEESRENTLNLNGRFGLSYAPKTLVGPFKWTSSAGFSEGWNYRNFLERKYKEVDVVQPDSTVVTEVVFDAENSTDLSETETQPSLSFSNRLSTDLYGIFDTSLGPVRGIKHKISFSAAHSYRPKLGSKQSKSQSISFSLGNELSLKLLDSSAGTERAADSTATEEAEPQYRKLNQLLSWDLTTSVDPDADPGLKWRDIQSSVRIRPGITQAISFSMNQTLDPYSFKIKSTRFNSDLRLRGTLGLGGSLSERQDRKNKVIERLPAPPPDSLTAAQDSLRGFQDDANLDPWGDPLGGDWLETGDRNAMPWDIYLRGSLIQTRNLLTDATTTKANLSTRANLGLPGKWRLSYSADFDVETGEFTNQFWTLTRPLHQWELRFSRGLADGQDFGFSLYLKDIPDLRLDRGDRARSGDLRGRLSSF